MSSNELEKIKNRQLEITKFNITIYFFIILGILLFTALNIFDVFTGIIIMLVMFFLIFGGQYIHYMSYRSYYLENSATNPHKHLQEEEIRKQILADISNNDTSTETTGTSSSTNTSSSSSSASSASASSASDVSGNSHTTVAGKCPNGKFIWENYLEKYSLLEHGTSGETVPDDVAIKKIKLEFTPVVLDWYDGSAIQNITEKLPTGDDLLNGNIDVSLNGTVILNQVQIWEHSGNDDIDEYGDDGVMNMATNTRSLTFKAGNVDTIVTASNSGLQNGPYLNGSFVNPKHLIDNSFNTCFIAGMRDKNTSSIEDGVVDSFTMELHTSKNIKDLTNIVFYTPYTLRGCDLILLNQDNVELLRQPISHDAKIYQFRMGSISDEKMISEFAKKVDTTQIWRYIQYELGGKITNSRQQYAEEHASKKSDNKYDCTKETFTNLFVKSDTYEKYKMNNISCDCV